MSEQIPVLYQWLISQGVAIGMVLWFAVRLEKKLDEVTKVLSELCQRIEIG